MYNHYVCADRVSGRVAGLLRGAAGVWVVRRVKGEENNAQ